MSGTTCAADNGHPAQQDARSDGTVFRILPGKHRAAERQTSTGEMRNTVEERPFMAA